MTELFKQRVAAFQMFLDFPGPYAVSIRAFMRDVLYRLDNRIALEDRQAELLLTHDLNQIHSVLDEFAISVEQSAVRLRMLLAQGDISSAFRYSRGWADNYWRQYEHVLDMYVFEKNPHLKEPSEASREAVANLRSIFPINIQTSGDPHEGRIAHFEEQLRQYGNPWK